MSILPAAGLTSRLYTLSGTSDLMHATPYYDEQRNFVVNDRNIHTTEYQCSNKYRHSVSLQQESEDMARQLEPVVPPVRMTERRRAVLVLPHSLYQLEC